MPYYSKYIQSAHSMLERLEVTDRSGNKLDPEAGFEQWCAQTSRLAKSGGTHFFAGNGASATMASHMALDCTKNGGFNAMAFNDSAFLTAIGNDIGQDSTFSFPLEKFGKAGDMLITVSSSGNSPNIIKALESARNSNLFTVTLSGMKPGNASRSLGDLNFYVPAQTYGIVECTHQIVLHCWLDKVMDIREWDQQTGS